MENTVSCDISIRGVGSGRFIWWIYYIQRPPEYFSTFLKSSHSKDTVSVRSCEHGLAVLPSIFMVVFIQCGNPLAPKPRPSSRSCPCLPWGVVVEALVNLEFLIYSPSHLRLRFVVVSTVVPTMDSTCSSI